MSKPHWNILTKRLIAEEIIYTGLTIPYLFGAYQILGYDIEDIKGLLTCILNTPHGKEFPVIERCDVIQYDVLKLEGRSKANNNKSYKVAIPNARYSNKLFISYNTSLGQNLDEVSSSLSKNYQNEIDNRAFSWDNKARAWRPFQPSEIEIIESIW
jgi:hypothetical protein